MSQPKRTISNHDILLIKNWAREYLMQLPAQTVLEGTTKPLGEGDQLALAYIHAVLSYVGEPGLHITIKTHEPLPHEPV
jgi:hypothetical protein